MPTTTPQHASGHTPNKTRHLIADALDAQRHYLIEALELLMRYGTLRLHGLAFGLFPNRPKAAAQAAAHRVVANATQRGFIACADEQKTRFRYYALTASGARLLQAHGNTDWASSTTHLLNKLTRAHHREWTNLCSIAALRRGLESYAETDYYGQSFREDLNKNFEHVPDALTFADIANQRTAVWHEIELSRRSTRSPFAPVLPVGKMDNSGISKFRNLLQTLRQRRVLLHNGVDHTLMLVVHCANSTLLNILVKHLYAYAADNKLTLQGNVLFNDETLPAHKQHTDSGAFSMPFEAKGMGLLQVRFYVCGRRCERAEFWPVSKC